MRQALPVMSIGGVYLFVVILGLGSQPTISYQKRYETLAQCELARAAVVKQYPQAYAVCDR
jgi:hypothetical protein